MDVDSLKAKKRSITLNDNYFFYVMITTYIEQKKTTAKEPVDRCTFKNH